jgi:hypothetical protein
MAADLRDLRAKITVETDAVIDAISRVTGKDRSEIVRDWLHEKAAEQIAIFSVLQDRLKAEGITAASEGASGSKWE